MALITGGSTGVGRGTADRLVRAGMHVVATSRHPEKYTQSCLPNHTFAEPGNLCTPGAGRRAVPCDGWEGASWGQSVLLARTHSPALAALQWALTYGFWTKPIKRRSTH